MACLNINKKSKEWRNFVDKVGNEGDAIGIYVVNGYKIPENYKTEVDTKPVNRFSVLVDQKKHEIASNNNIITALNKDKSNTIDIASTRRINSEIKALENKNKLLEEELVLLRKDEALLSPEEAIQNAIANFNKFAKKDLQAARDILASEYISASDIRYAIRQLKVWEKAGDFSRANIFMSQDDLAQAVLEGDNNIFKEMRDALANWRVESQIALKQLDEKAIKLVEAEKVKDLKFKPGVNADSTKDISPLHANLLNIGLVDNSNLQALHSWRARADFAAVKESQKKFKEIEDLFKKVDKKYSRKEVQSLFKQKHKDKETGNATSWISQEFWNDLRDINRDRRNRLKDLEGVSDVEVYSKLVARNNAMYKEALRKIQQAVDFRKLFPSNEESEFTEKDREEYIKYLKTSLSEVRVNEIIKDAEKKLKLYERDLSILQEELANNPNDAYIQKELELFKANKSPFLNSKYYVDGFSPKKIGSDWVTPSNQFFLAIPKFESKYFDEQFKKIESDEDLLNLYNYTVGTVQEMNMYLPSEKIDFMQVNSLPHIRKDIIESFFEDGVGGGVKAIYDNIIEATRTSDLSTSTKSTDRDINGNPIYKLQTSFILDPQAEISNYVELKKIQYIQDKGKEPDVETMDSWRRDKADELSKEKSWDLERMVKAYSMMALSYKHKSQIQDIMELTFSQVTNTQESEVNKAGQELKDENGNKTTKPGFVNTINAASNFMENFYGYNTKKQEGLGGKIYTPKESKTKKEVESAIEKNIENFENQLLTEEEFKDINTKLYEKLNKLGGVTVKSNMIDMLLKYIQIKGMGWNVLGAFSNLGFGQVGNLIEASGGQRFNMEQLKKANALAMYSIGKNYAFDTNISKTANKIRNAMDNFDVLKESKNEIFEMKNNKLGKFKFLAPYNVNARTEYLNQAPVMIAIMLNTPITLKDGTISNVWDSLNEEGELPDGITYSENVDEVRVKERIDEAIRVIHGDYDPNSNIRAKNSLIGRALLQFRSWALMGFYDRFGGENYNQIAGISTKGRYRSYGALYSELGSIKGTIEITKQLLRKAASIPGLKSITKIDGTNFDAIEGLTETDVANLRKNMTEIVVYMTALTLGLLMRAMFKGDDDDDSLLSSASFIAINQMSRIQTDMLFYSSPIAFEQLSKNAIPAFGFVVDAERFIGHVSGLLVGDDDTIDRGIYGGMSGTGLYGSRLFPLITQGSRFISQGSQIFDK